VSSVLNEYFEQVDPELINGLYDMVLSEVEAPLLEAVMQKARSNQSKAAQMLGLNRGTLRKKLKQYDMLE
jgi:Fis family transcriptional regulator